MEIRLPSTLTGEYYPDYARGRGATPGKIQIRFGEALVTEISVTEEQHERLSSTGFYGWEAQQRVEADAIVAAWLREKWGL